VKELSVMQRGMKAGRQPASKGILPATSGPLVVPLDVQEGLSFKQLAGQGRVVWSEAPQSASEGTGHITRQLAAF